MHDLPGVSLGPTEEGAQREIPIFQCQSSWLSCLSVCLSLNLSLSLSIILFMSIQLCLSQTVQRPSPTGQQCPSSIVVCFFALVHSSFFILVRLSSFCLFIRSSNVLKGLTEFVDDLLARSWRSSPKERTQCSLESTASDAGSFWTDCMGLVDLLWQKWNKC